MNNSFPSSSSHFQKLFESALQNYERQTGTKLAEHPLAGQLEKCTSVESIIAIIIQGHARPRVFGRFRRMSDVKVAESLRRTVSLLYPLSTSNVFGRAIRTPFSPTGAAFASLYILLTTLKGANASDHALVDLLESIEHFLSRLNVYAKMPLTATAAMTEIAINILIEILSTFALVTKKIKQQRSVKFIKNLLEDNEIKAVLQRLDRLTQDEVRTTAVQTLEVVHGLAQDVRVVMDDRRALAEGAREALQIIQQISSDVIGSKTSGDKYE